MSWFSSRLLKQQDCLTTTKWNALLWYGYEVWIRHDRHGPVNVNALPEKPMDTCSCTDQHLRAASSVFCSWRQSSATTPTHRHSPWTYTVPALHWGLHHTSKNTIHTLIRSRIEVYICLQNLLGATNAGGPDRKGRAISDSDSCSSMDLHCGWKGVVWRFTLIWILTVWMSAAVITHKQANLAKLVLL